MKKIGLLLVLSFFITGIFSQNITKPEDFFGFKPGADGMLFNYDKLIEYLKIVDNQSDKVSMVEIGVSTFGKPIYILLISSEENIKNMNRLKEINRKLALDYRLSDSERDILVKEGKVFVLASLSMHSTEVSPTQALPLIVYDQITSTDPNMQKILKDVVYMATPCHNPDGMDLIVDNFNKYKGTKYEGTNLPGVYHKYVGHDNNRDFVVLSQNDTKAFSMLTSTDWFPQVMAEKHQMGSTGPRYFVPPYHDPIAENIDAELWTWAGLFGQNMINDMTAKGLAGVSQHTLFDDYWPGSAETCNWKNVISMLTEGASAKIAKPIYIEFTELNAWGKGLSEYKKSTNMPEPWLGGWWRLSDLVQYEIASTESMLNTASLYKDRILTFRNDICKKEVNKGQNQAPYYFIVPENQKDKSELVDLVNLLKEHGVEVSKLNADFTLNNYTYKKGDIVVSCAQPFRPFVKEVMEVQKFPVRHYTPDGEMINPYDITSWSLPLHKGLTSFQIDTRNTDFEKQLVKIDGLYTLGNSTDKYEYAILNSTNNQAYKLVFEALSNGLKVDRSEAEFVVDGNNVTAGSFIIKKQPKFDNILKNASFPVLYTDKLPALTLTPVAMPRIGFVETYMSDMDAGWTRFIFDTYSIKFTVLRPGDFETADLTSKYDIIIFPDQDASIIKEGKMKRENTYFTANYPPEYAKGIGQKGFDNLMTFTANGGIIISWGQSTALFEGNLAIKEKAKSEKEKPVTEEFKLPFRNVGDGLVKKGLNCPGSLIKLNLLEKHPLTWGMQSTTGIFFESNIAFSTSIPNFDMDRRVIGYFGEDNHLLSGFLEGGKYLYNTSAMIWLKKGKGQFVLFGFSPIFRASVPGNYKLLFNSILLPKLK
ncbi:MAG: M14 family metallopeptidase [Tenuifilaceae bacterium]